jgi:hypothetical protein
MWNTQLQLKTTAMASPFTFACKIILWICSFACLIKMASIELFDSASTGCNSLLLSVSGGSIALL